MTASSKAKNTSRLLELNFKPQTSNFKPFMYSNFLNIIDILGTFAFAVSGAFSAMERKLDPFGTLIISFVTAVGGGTLRDVLVGNLPVNWLQNDVAILIIFWSAIAAMLFGT